MRSRFFRSGAVYICALILGLAAVFSITWPAGRGLSRGASPTDNEIRELLRLEGWRLAGEDGTYREIQLPAYAPVRAGKTVRIVNTLPRALGEGEILAFESVNAVVDVRIDGELVYHNMPEGTVQVYSKWNYIPLAKDHSEARIMIEFSGPDAYDAGILPEILLGPRPEILLVAGGGISGNLQISISVALFGALVLLLSLVTYSDSHFFDDFILLGVFICALGISLLLQIVSPTGSDYSWFVRENIGTGMFGLLPALYCCYCLRRASEPLKKYYKGLFWGCVGFFALVYIMHWFGPAGVWPSVRVAIYGAFECVYVACFYLIVWKERGESRKYTFLIAVSLAALMLGMGLDSFTHLGYTSLRTLRPLVLGAFVFSLMQTVAAVFSAYEHISQQARTAQELTESRVRLAMNRLKPHFIRNALSSIREIIRHDPEKARELLYDFAKYITFNIDALEGTELVPFSEELRHIREYAGIEQELMNHRLTMEYDIDDDGFPVPPLSIQPFVENAIKHGVWQKGANGTVRVMTREMQDAHIITITDDGKGFDTANPPKPALPGHGIGVQNATYRLRQMVDGTVEIHSKPGEGTTVTITVPILTNTGRRREAHI